jgi:hypothetical protein
MGQAVIPQSPTAEARARTQTSPCEIYDKVVDMGKVFLRVIRLYPVSILSPMLHNHSFIFYRRYIDSAVQIVIK